MGDDLQYGHLGRVRFDSDSQRWLFGRYFCNDASEALGVSQIHIDTSGNSQVVHERRKRAAIQKQLLRAFPDFGATHGFLEDYSKPAGPLHNSENVFNVPTGDLLASAPFQYMHEAHSHTVFAFAAGDAREKLGLVVARNFSQGWISDRNIALGTLHPEKHEVSLLDSGRGTIQQIAFSGIGNAREKSLLAIRYPATVVVVCLYDFREQMTYTGQTSGWMPSSKSRLALAILGHVEASQLSGHLVDVAFNPHNPLQVATARSDGRLNIWQVPQSGYQGHVRLTNSDRHLLLLGSTLIEPKAPKTAPLPLHKWCRVFWLGASSHYIVAVRRSQMVLFRITDSGFELQHEQSFPDAEPIRRATRDPQAVDQLIVLTSSHVHCLVLQIDPAHSLHGSREASLENHRSWKHYRDAADTTLKLACRTHSSGDTRVILYSKHSDLVSEYDISSHVSAKISKTPSIVDPAVLDIARVSTVGLQDYQKQSIADLLILPCPYVERSTLSEDNSEDRVPDYNIGETYRDRGYSFYQVFILNNNLSLSSSIQCDLNRLRGKRDDPMLEAPTWSSYDEDETYAHTSHISEPFIAEDDWLDNKSKNSSFSTALTSSFGRGFYSILEDMARLDELEAARVMPYAEAYNETLPKAKATERSLSAALTVLRDDLTSVGIGHSETRDIWESMVHDPPLLDDVELADAALQDTLAAAGVNSITGSRYAQVYPIMMPPLNGLRGTALSDDRVSISQFYHHCVKHWITPLPSLLPGSARLARDRSARQVTTAVILSSLRLEDRSGSTTSQQPDTETPSQDVPSSPPLPLAQPELSLSGLQISSRPPTFSLPSTQPTTSEDPDPNPLESAISRLSRYSTITPPNPAPEPTQTLSHVLPTWGSYTGSYEPRPPPSATDPAPADATTRRREARKQLEKRKQDEQLLKEREERLKRPRLGRTFGSSPPRDAPAWSSGAASSQVKVSSRPRVRDPQQHYAYRAEATPFGRFPVGDLQARAIDRLAQQRERERAARSAAGANAGIVQSQVQPGVYGGRRDAGRKVRKPGF